MPDLDSQRVVERFLREVLSGQGPASTSELVSNEAVRQRMESFRAAFPDLVVMTHLIVANGEYVAVHATGRGTHRGIFQGVRPTGRSWTATCSALYRVADGRIADSWINWDLLAILEQLGAVRRPADASA